MAWTPFNFFEYDSDKVDFTKTTFNIKQALNNNWEHLKTLIIEIRNAVDRRGNTQTTRVANVSILASAWTTDTTFTDYPYKATLQITGVKSTMECKTFMPDHTIQDLQYLFAPWVNTGAGTLEVWANSKPTAAVTIELITFEEVLS
ncbi:MAG: hypothetical protein ACI4WY_07450 [Anaerovoracaceae bacterium]